MYDPIAVDCHKEKVSYCVEARLDDDKGKLQAHTRCSRG